MEAMNEAIKRSRPVLGALSILLPAFGAGLWLFFAKHPHLGDGMNGYVGLLIWLVLVGLSAALVVGGITCAVMGLVRRERWRLLAIVGLALNLGIMWYFKR
jgi:hypothetical protein